MRDHRFGGGGIATRLACVALLSLPMAASARNFRVGMLPNGSTFGCGTCHVSAGGGGARNPFGQAVGGIVGSSSAAFWSPTLAALDSDGDGTANGAELGDPDGDGSATAGARVTNPGNANSKPPSNVAPVVSISGPLSGATLTAPALTPFEVTATDSDGTVAKVEFFDGERLLGTDSAAPYSLLVDWALGNHTITAKATDNAGAATTSAAVSMTVNPPAATQVTRVVRNGGNVEVAWTPGGGPYAVQSKGDVMDAWCVSSGVTTGLTATVAYRGDLGFFRVADLAVGGVIPLSVVLSGAYERPSAIATAGTGSGTLRLEGNTLTFSISYSGLSGPATRAHIHGPAGTEVSTGVMIDLEPFNGGSFGTSGTLAGSVVLTTDQKAAVLSGMTYVNVHTAANAPGEIRGQVVPVAMGATLSGAQEAPAAVITAGKGSAHFTIQGDQLSFVITYTGLSGAATRAHIHGPAAIGVSAAVLIDLAPFHDGPLAASGRFVGTVTLTPEQLVSVVSGLTYVNVHTAANAPGEIRGQLLPCVTGRPLAATLSGASEVPAVTTSGTGRAILRLEGDVLSFDIQYAGLSGAATRAHFHGPAAAGVNAGVMIDLAAYHQGPFGSSGAFTGAVTLSAVQKEALLGGLMYVNVHTAANTPGEIRGQVLTVGLP